MNSDEYLGGMSSDRPFAAFVLEEVLFPFYLHLIYKTAKVKIV
jgi:hypothetical protein